VGLPLVWGTTVAHPNSNSNPNYAMSASYGLAQAAMLERRGLKR